MKIYTENGKCQLEFDITNLNSTQTKNIYINFYDKNQKTIYIKNYSLPNITKGETKTEKLEINIDVSNAYDYSIQGL